ncbi:MAG: nicotinamide mononucleotide transporter, partial [Bacteroidales bacterium]|nr:nicotinamide mononucleotide transporter [Bacteroidales bacterium]
MDWINIALFELGGKPVLLVDLISSLLGLTTVFLAGRNSKYNFWVGYLYTAALFFLFWSRNLYANLLLQPISLAINVFGHWRWTHPKEEERSSEDA